MSPRIFAFVVACALLSACSGDDDAALQQTPPAPSEQAAAPPAADPAPPARRRLSGVERKRQREAAGEFGKGFELLYGKGTPRDPARAHEHLLKAAELGHARSMGIVGVNYQRGRGTAKDPEQAIRWLEAGAEAGWPHAQLKLGEAYRDGWGVDADPVLAMKWLALSGRGGSIAGTMIANSYAGSLPPRQREAGLQLARQWRIEHGMPVRGGPDDGIRIETEVVPPPIGQRPAAVPPPIGQRPAAAPPPAGQRPGSAPPPTAAPADPAASAPGAGA